MTATPSAKNVCEQKRKAKKIMYRKNIKEVALVGT
jgi:hypothetical protein